MNQETLIDACVEALQTFHPEHDPNADEVYLQERFNDLTLSELFPTYAHFFDPFKKRKTKHEQANR